MAQVRLSDAVPHHPKFLRAGPAACWLYVCGIAHCQRLLTDGFIDALTISTIGVNLVQQPDAIDALVRAGLWDVVEGGWRIHDYLDHNKTARKVRAIRRQKRLSGRAGGIARAKQSAKQSAKHFAKPRAKQKNSVRHARGIPDRDRDRTSVRTPYAPPPEVLPTEGSRASTARARSQPGPFNPSPPLIPSPLALRSYAYPNEVVGVPAFCHTRYVQRLTNAGVDRQAAERQLLDWYDEVCRQYRGQRIGDKEADFWDQRFEEWQGRTPKAATTSTGSVAARNAAFLRQRQERSS